MLKIKFTIIENNDCYFWSGEFNNYTEAQMFINENRADGNEIHVLTNWHRAKLQHTKPKNFLKILG